MSFHAKLAMNLMAVMLGRNTYAAALVVTKVERPLTSIGGLAICLGDHENAFRGVLGANQRIFRLLVKPDGPGEFAVIDPTSQHELVLVFDVRVDEITQNPALHAIVRFRRIVGRPVRQKATHQPVRVIAAAGLPLTRDWLTSWIDAAYVCADGTADPLRISRTIGIHILEIVHLFGRNPTRRAIRVR